MWSLQLFLLLSMTAGWSSAVECEFKFVESDFDIPSDDKAINETLISDQTMELESFDCEDPQFEDSGRRVESRINFDFTPEIDEYETVTVCDVHSKTIYPKAMNSVKNKLTPLAIDHNHVEAIQIEECASPGKSCSGEYSTRSQKTVCKQKYVKIWLKALDGQRKVYDELFYFPSLCACELVKLKDFSGISRN